MGNRYQAVWSSMGRSTRTHPALTPSNPARASAAVRSARITTNERETTPSSAIARPPCEPGASPPREAPDHRRHGTPPARRRSSPSRPTHAALASIGSLSPDRGGAQPWSTSTSISKSPPRTGARLTVRVLRSPAGEATGTMRLPFDELVLQNRLQALQIALLRSGTTRRRVETPESHTVAEVRRGALGRAVQRRRPRPLRGEPERGAAARRRGCASSSASRTRRSRPCRGSTCSIAGRGDYVALSASTPLVRYIPLPQVMEPLAVQPPLRVLGMIASPSDLDGTRRRAGASQRLERALGELVDARARRAGLDDRIDGTRPPGDAAARSVAHLPFRRPRRVRREPGRGSDRPRRPRRERSSRVSATDLGRLLGDHDPLRLAVLNACESGRGDSVDVFSSTAATLVRRGTPAVVAMQYEITDEAAIEFSRSFYEAIADGIPVDAALAEARKGVAMAIPGTLGVGDAGAVHARPGRRAVRHPGRGAGGGHGGCGGGRIGRDAASRDGDGGAGAAAGRGSAGRRGAARMSPRRRSSPRRPSSRHRLLSRPYRARRSARGDRRRRRLRTLSFAALCRRPRRLLSPPPRRRPPLPALSRAGPDQAQPLADVARRAGTPGRSPSSVGSSCSSGWSSSWRSARVPVPRQPFRSTPASRRTPRARSVASPRPHRPCSCRPWS